MLDICLLGTGGMMPLPYRHLTSVLLRRDGDLFLFDGGEGTQVSLRRLNLKWKKINAIFVSHTHADHVTGLPGIMMLSSQVDRDEPLYIYGPPKIAEYIETSRKVLDMYINYPVIVKEITDEYLLVEYNDGGKEFVNLSKINFVKSLYIILLNAYSTSPLLSLNFRNILGSFILNSKSIIGLSL